MSPVSDFAKIFFFFRRFVFYLTSFALPFSLVLAASEIGTGWEQMDTLGGQEGKYLDGNGILATGTWVK